MDTKRMGFNTKMVHAGAGKDAYGSAVVPIYQTSTFAFESAQNGADRFAGKADGYIYTRIGNPTIRALERNVAELEHGADGVATSSGMGAVNVIYMALLAQGAHIVSTASVYGPSRGLIEKHFSRFGVEYTFVDTSDIENVRAAIRPNTKVVYLESPSNPAMLVTDIRAVSDLAHQHGAPRGRGQHLREPVPAEAARPRRRRRLPLGDQVHQRARRRRGRDHRRARTRRW